MSREDDRVILLANAGDSLDDASSFNQVDETGMFSLTDVDNGEDFEHKDSDDSNVRRSRSQDQDEIQEPACVVYVAAVVAAVGGLLFGYDIGVISGAKSQIQNELQLSCAQIEAIVAMLPFGAFVASLLGGSIHL